MLGACALVVAKPLFDVFSDHPDYFIVNGIAPSVLALWVAALALAPPLLLALAVHAVRRLSARWAARLQIALLSALAAAFALQICRSLGMESVFTSALIGAVVLGLSFLALRRLPQILFGLALLAPGALVFPALFLLEPEMLRLLKPAPRPVAAAQEPQELRFARKPPVVLVVLDELPLLDLLNPGGDIDPVRFPNFAAFADDSIWFENATTVSPQTTLAVPAVLTGRWPPAGLRPNHEDHPRNLFALLAPHYELNVVESVTRLNPDAATWQEFRDVRARGDGGLRRLLGDSLVVFLYRVTPRGLAHHLPPTHQKWGGFLQSPDPAWPATDQPSARGPGGELSRKVQARRQILESLVRGNHKGLFEGFIQSYATTDRVSLNFLHVLLPHQPQVYLPSGKNYHLSAYQYGLRWDQESQVWNGAQTGLDILHQQHLLQIAFTDRLWGALIAEIKRLGRYDESLIILVSDHGISFQEGLPNRHLHPGNFADLAFVPLLVKPPFSQGAVRDGRNASLVDLLPTVMDVLGADPGWPVEGRSLLGNPGSANDAGKQVVMHDGSTRLYSATEYLVLKRQALERRVQRFRLGHPKAGLFRYQDGIELLDRPVSEILGWRLPCKVSAPDFDRLLARWPSLGKAPQKIHGRLECPASEGTDPLVVIENAGRIFGTTRPWQAEDRLVFGYVFPEFESLDPGALFALSVIDYPP